jgi:hypothetical protein
VECDLQLFIIISYTYVILDENGRKVNQNDTGPDES